MCRILSLTSMNSLPMSATNPTHRSKSGYATLSNGLRAITITAERYPAPWLNAGAARLPYINSASIDPHMLKNIYRADDAEAAAAARKDFADGTPRPAIRGHYPPSVAKSQYALVH